MLPCELAQAGCSLASRHARGCSLASRHARGCVDCTLPRAGIRAIACCRGRRSCREQRSKTMFTHERLSRRVEGARRGKGVRAQASIWGESTVRVAEKVFVHKQVFPVSSGCALRKRCSCTRKYFGESRVRVAEKGVRAQASISGD